MKGVLPKLSSVIIATLVLVTIAVGVAAVSWLRTAPPAAQVASRSTVIGGIEALNVDGKQFFYGFSYRADRVLTPLFESPGEMASYATARMRQQDGTQDSDFWVAAAREALIESSLAEPADLVVRLDPLRAAIRRLRTAPSEDAQLIVPSHVSYLLNMNAEWPDSDPPVSVAEAAVRIGLESDDISPWLDESAAMIRGDQPFPEGGTHADAARVFLWYWDTLVGHQRHGWAERLRLRDL
jgi:hypothetical protein